MKISKLFHWLYALVMLLPIFAIGTTCLITTFNMSGKEESEVHYKYETNEVNSNDDLIVGNIYKLSYNLPSVENVEKVCDIQNIFNFTRNTLAVLVNAEQQNNRSFYIANTSTNLALYSDNSLWVVSDTKVHQVNNYVYIVYDGNFNIDYLSYITISDYIPIEDVETHNLNAEEVFYNSINKLQQSPLFNWAYDSFLVTPFSYIANVFSLQTNSVIVMLLSYWLAISVIWLVFDVIMYVPLLVHRWMDKGVIE